MNAKPQNELRNSAEDLFYVGIGRFKVVGLNTDSTENYVREDVQDGVRVKKVILDFELKSYDKPEIEKTFHFKINLVNLPAKSSQGKTQFINQRGVSVYASSEDELKTLKKPDGNLVYEYFLKKKFRSGKVKNFAYHPAIRGEAALYDFLRNWLNIDWTYEDTDIFINLKKLFLGDFSELKNLIVSSYAQYPDGSPSTIIMMATLRYFNGNIYQSFHNKDFMPGYRYNEIIMGGKVTTASQASSKFVKNIMDEKYGCRDFYLLTPLTLIDMNNPALQGYIASIRELTGEFNSEIFGSKGDEKPIISPFSEDPGDSLNAREIVNKKRQKEVSTSSFGDEDDDIPFIMDEPDDEPPF